MNTRNDDGVSVGPRLWALDTNVWIATGLLRSPPGPAFAHAVQQANHMILLPDIVKREVEEVLLRKVGEASSEIRKRFEAVAKLVGRRDDVQLPTDKETRESTKARFDELASILLRTPTNERQLREMVDRALHHVPPHRTANDQIIDTLLWLECLEQVASGTSVTVLSKDSDVVRAGQDGEVRVLASLGEALREIGASASFSTGSAEEPLATALSANSSVAKVLQSAGAGLLGKPSFDSLRAYATAVPDALDLEFVAKLELVFLDGSGPGTAVVRGSAAYRASASAADTLVLPLIQIFDENGRGISTNVLASADPFSRRREIVFPVREELVE